jgi:hypothetical protein
MFLNILYNGHGTVDKIFNIIIQYLYMEMQTFLNVHT